MQVLKWTRLVGEIAPELMLDRSGTKAQVPRP